MVLISSGTLNVILRSSVLIPAAMTSLLEKKLFLANILYLAYHRYRELFSKMFNSTKEMLTAGGMP